MAELRPVEFDLVTRKGGLELTDEVVGDTNVVRVSAKVGEGEMGRKVVGMEQTKQEACHGEQASLASKYDEHAASRTRVSGEQNED